MNDCSPTRCSCSSPYGGEEQRSTCGARSSGAAPALPEHPLSDLRDQLAAHDGATIPGGCDHCNATQALRNDGAGIFTLTITHTHDCPSRNP